MQNNLVLAGKIAGLLGILLCIVAGVARATGNFYLAGMSVETILQGGTTGVVIGGFLLLLAKA